jgi:mitochondrial import inner membrane translocase subunit TIM17
MEQQRPCPGRIPLDCGVAYGLGLVFGGIINTIRGYRLKPNQRFNGIAFALRTKGAGFALNFATWGLLFSSFDCILTTLRGAEGASNRIIAGGTTSMLLSIRG